MIKKGKFVQKYLLYFFSNLAQNPFYGNPRLSDARLSPSVIIDLILPLLQAWALIIFF